LEKIQCGGLGKRETGEGSWGSKGKARHRKYQGIDKKIFSGYID
jgi:hypothetical protein